MVIETHRLCLRPALNKDIPFLVLGLNDWNVAQWLISAPYPYAETDGQWFIDWTNTADENGFNAKFVIADRKTDELLGVVTLVSENSRAELGYWLLPSAQKNGYMLEAVQATLDYARESFSHLTCFATIDPANYSSEKCLASSGLTFSREYQREKCRRNGSVDTKLYEIFW